MLSAAQKYGLLYTAGRAGLFLAVGGVLFAVGFRSYWLVALSLVLSVPLSYVLLKPIRLKWGYELERGIERRRENKAKLRSALRGDGPEPGRGTGT